MSLQDFQHEVVSETWVAVGGSFAPNGSSAVSASSIKGDGWTVVRTSTGLFTVTFTEARQNLVHAYAWLSLNVAGDSYVQAGAYTPASGTLPIRVMTTSYTAAVAASGTIVCVAKASLVDAETVTIGDGLTPAKVYEFDVSGNGVTAGNVQVNVSADTTAVQVATRLVTAINANQPAITAANSAGASSTVTLTHDIPGVVGNVTTTDTVANVGFTTTGLASGAAPVFSAAVGDISGGGGRVNFMAIFGQSSAQNP